MILICVKCEKKTDSAEADQRIFNTGFCGFCGGNLYDERQHRENIARVRYLKDELNKFEQAGYKIT